MTMRVVDGEYKCDEVYDDFKIDYTNPLYTRPQLIDKYDLRISEYRVLARRVKKETGYDKKGRYSKNNKLWNASKVYFNRKNQLELKPSKSFYLKYDNHLLNLGIGFKEPVSCEIIYDLIKEFS